MLFVLHFYPLFMNTSKLIIKGPLNVWKDDSVFSFRPVVPNMKSRAIS